jgi:Arc/MetJ-type ribon-helix-helix transcriptional regulator
MEAPQVVHWLREILNLHGQVDRTNPLHGFRSVEQVRSKQQELVEEHIRFLQRQEEERISRLLAEEELPAPPVPGTSDIIPLVRASELREEGRAQHHCVGDYARSVGRGERYVYRVLSPERATLSIVRGADGCWQIEQLYRACNQSVSEATRAAIQAWLGKYSLSV